MTERDDGQPRPPSTSSQAASIDTAEPSRPELCRLIDVYDHTPDGYDGTCLRPLGLCELGGACESCWYNSNREGSIGRRPA